MIIETEYLLIALGVLLLYVIYYVLSRDARYTKQIRAIAGAVEESNRRLYRLEKELGERITALGTAHDDDGTDANREALERRVQQVAAQVGHALAGVEEGLGGFKEEMEKRMRHVEEGMRQLTMPSSVTGTDDEKIISLYKQGIPLEAIAKELRVSKTEVEFVLKINKIR